MIFHIPISKCHQTFKQIAVGSTLVHQIMFLSCRVPQGGKGWETLL